ncbi:MAG TPA: glycosyltransferase [Prolixibacteraceae bacterium]|nr:glycosyltransferase [Prolixibacteraceae bacterium]
MKIFIMGPAHPYRGGIAALNDRLSQQLIDEGHQVELISFRLQYPGFLFPGKTQYTTAPKPDRIVVRDLINSINPLNWLIIGCKLKREKPDLVIVRFWLPFMAPSTGTICKLIRRNKHTKIISIVDNLLPHEHRPGDKLFTKYFANAVDGFLAMSGSVYNDLDLFIGTKPKIFSPHPIYDHYGEKIEKEKAIAQLGLDPAFRYVLFFGFIRDYKGLDLLLHAMASETISTQNIKLLVAGEFYSNEKKYLDLIASLNLNDSTILHTDYIPEDKVNLYFCAADIIAQPYKSATQSGVTQIGYHFEKPMLVTNVGGLPEIIEDQKCGYVVDVNSEAIANALHDFYQNKRESKMVAEVKKAKAKFEWDKLTKAIFEIFKHCS